MLTYLLQVAARVIDTFSNLYFSLSWLVRSALWFVQIYVSAQFGIINDYQYSRRSDLVDYQHNIKPWAWLYFIYGRSRTDYVVNQSYGDISDYRFNLRGPLQDWAFHGRPWTNAVRNKDKGQISHLTAMEVTDSFFLHHVAPQTVSRYKSRVETTVEGWVREKTRVNTLIEGPRHTRIMRLADELYHSVEIYRNEYEPGLGGLIRNKPKLDHLTVPERFVRLDWLSGQGYGGILDAQGKVVELGPLLQDNRLPKVIDFADKGYGEVNKLVEGQADYVLNLIEDEFLQWLWNMIYTRFMLPGE